MTYSIGKIFGIEVKIHLLLLVIIAWGAYDWIPKYGLEGAVFGAALISVVFFCILLHEFGHSLMAQYFGIPVHSITLWPLGGLALLSQRPKTPKQGLLISLAGPAVNIAISLALALACTLMFEPAQMKSLANDLRPGLPTFLVILCINNFVLAVFNLIPAFPLDGGMVLLHLLAAKLPQQKAWKITGFVGRLIAVMMGSYAMYNLWFMMVAISVFIFISSPMGDSHDDIYAQ